MIALLVIIYLSFVSLGLPNSLLGSAWPVMQGEFGAAVGAAGYISMLIFGATVISTLLSSRVIARFGPGRTVIACIFLLVLGLFGFSFATRLWMLWLCAIPIGLGSGCVDTALNNFVALHYEPRHMSWLHCFWGIGATLGPVILSFQLRRGGGWRAGYRTVAALLLALFLLLVCTARLWRRADGRGETGAQTGPLTSRQVLALPHMKLVLVSFLLAAAIEMTTGLWCGSYLTGARGFTPEDGALVVSYHFAAITIGRLAAGFLAARLGDDGLVRLGCILSLAGCVLMLLPFAGVWATAGVILLGLGIGQVYPNLIHTTPRRYGAEVSQSVVGLEMSVANLGNTFVPPLFGLLATHVSVGPLPVFLLVCTVILFVSSELARRKLRADAVSP